MRLLKKPIDDLIPLRKINYNKKNLKFFYNFSINNELALKFDEIFYKDSIDLSDSNTLNLNLCESILEIDINANDKDGCHKMFYGIRFFMSSKISVYWIFKNNLERNIYYRRLIEGI